MAIFFLPGMQVLSIVSNQLVEPVNLHRMPFVCIMARYTLNMLWFPLIMEDIQ